MINRLNQNIMKFKIAMLALAGIAFMQPDASAQSSKYDKNYPVCKKDGKYEICTHAEKHANNKQMSSSKATVAKTNTKQAEPIKPKCEVTEVVYVTSSSKENPRFAVSYDMPGDVYEGKEVMSNDGVQANRVRNINYLDTSVENPPNDGGLATK